MCAKAAMARSISPVSRTLIGVTSMPNDGATAWIAATWPWPPAMAGSRRTATRATPGAISLSSSSHFPLMPYSNWTNPVALPPGRAKLATKPAADRIGNKHEYDRHRAGCLQQRCHAGSASGQYDIRSERDQFGGVSADAVGIARSPAMFYLKVLAYGPAQLR